jgi:Ran GTPase-activating protein (RanGAP) involved in mRNA processing and transport
MLVVPRFLQRASTTDLSGNEMGKEYENDMSGVIALAIPGMGGLFSANLLKNDIGVDQAMVLASILKGHPALMSLCGHKGDETELDMSGEGLGDIAIVLCIMLSCYRAIMLSCLCIPEIADNRALLVLSVESNRFFAGGGKALAEGFKGNQAIKELSIASNFLGFSSSGPPDMSGLTALAVILPNMGAITKLDACFNSTDDEGRRALKKAAVFFLMEQVRASAVLLIRK